MIFGRVVWAALWCGREIVGAGVFESCGDGEGEWKATLHLPPASTPHRA